MHEMIAFRVTVTEQKAIYIKKIGGFNSMHGVQVVGGSNPLAPTNSFISTQSIHSTKQLNSE